MSFLDLLKAAREEAKLSINKVDEVKAVLNKDIDNSDIHKETEVKTEVKTDISIAIGEAIIKSSKSSLKLKNLKSINSAKRLAKKISSGNIHASDLQKCFKLQQRFPKPANINYKLVGGEALGNLKMLMEKGVEVNQALNTKYERVNDE
jgi:hypothetical protein